MAAASQYDFWMVDEGCLVGLRAISDDAKDWMLDNIQENDSQLGQVQYIDSAYAGPILNDLLTEGYVITSPKGRLNLVHANA